MNKKTLAALLCAAFPTLVISAPCPGGAGWCDDFESGASHWLSAGGVPVPVQTQPGTQNRLLALADGAPLLVAASQTAALTQADYYVEARLRPSATTATASRRINLMARHVDERNWLGAVAVFTPGAKRMSVELVRMRDGKLVTIKKVGRDLDPGDGFYTLRLELAGGAFNLYINGERMTFAPDAFVLGGPVGLLAQDGGFDIDDVRVGPANLRPARVALARMASRIGLQAGDPPQRFAVSALDADGTSALPFTAVSSDPAVATVAVDGGDLVVRAHRPGAAIITLGSPADSNLTAKIAATVGPAFTTGARTYALRGRLAPAAQATGVQADTLLRITFDNAPTLGTTGSVRIFRAADNALVDVIRVADESDAIGHPQQEFKRVVRYNRIGVDGASVTIRPHNARLAYGTEYYVAIDDGVVTGATLGGQPFSGLGQQAGWRFRTRTHAPWGHRLSVDDDGPADLRTVLGALNHAMRYLPRAAPVTIRVANGRYEELLYLRGKDRVTLRGASRDGVVIHAANHDSLNPGSGLGQAANSPSATGGRSLFMIEDADMLTLDTLTLVNTSQRITSPGPQAETLYFNSEQGRLAATNATFLSEQDTIQVKGYSWFYRTLIAGNVDFIWGYNRAALFEQSEIRSVGDSANADSGGYVVQARTVAAGDPGFVFLNSRLTQGPGPAGNAVPAGATYLARSPGTASTWDNVSYIDCRMDAHVAPVGWAGEGVLRQPAPNPVTASAASGWSEYGSMDLAGRPLDLSQRVGGFRLSAAQAKERFGTRARIFQSFDNGKGWNPAPPSGK
jgi:pectin methylesterase-like acyl-CoA thioesterase